MTIRGWIVLLLLVRPAWADVAAMDDSGRAVALTAPAKRIVSLAPSITELLYAAGAGKKIVGAVDYSDYPEAALKLPRVGGSGALDVERIVFLKPDLVVAWKSGNPSGQIGKLRSLGITVFYAEPRHLSDIADDIERLGALAGTEETAAHSAREFRKDLAGLRRSYSEKSPVSVFFEIWPEPLMTVSDEHIISDVLHVCNARNVFGKLPVLTPTVSLESVIRENPQAIVASGAGGERPRWLDEWRKWDMTASRSGNLFFIPSDLISRPSPRILQAAGLLCRQLDMVRNN